MRIPSVLQAGAIWVSAALAMLVASMVVAAAAGTTAGGLAPGKVLLDPKTSPLLTSPVWIAIGTAANELAVGAVLLVWLFALAPTRSAVLPMAAPKPIAVVGSLLVVFGLVPLSDLAGRIVDAVVQSDVTATRVITEAAKRASPGELALLLFCVAVLPAIVEEAMFRGVITATFARRSFAVGLVVPSVLFGIFHIEPTQVAGTIVLGMGFGLVRLYTGSLVPCALAHGVYNAAVVLAVRHADVSEESAFSPVPLLLGAVVVALGVWLLRRDAPNHPARAKTPLPPPA